MSMTAVPSGSAPVWEIPADDVADEEVDVRLLAGHPAPDEGAWLWVTSADPAPGGELDGLILPANRPVACGGDVLAHVRPAGEQDGGTAAVRVQVWAVAAGSLVRVAGWDQAGLEAWPELVRAPAVFAIGALRALEEHGADVSGREQVNVTAVAGAAPAGFPSLPTRVNAAG
jgi:hypothetical protein